MTKGAGAGGLHLVADVGGTFTRFALADGVTARALAPETCQTGAWPSFETAAADYLTRREARVGAVWIAGAGPCTGESILLTNASWRIERAPIAAALGVATCTLLNDFEAVAFSVPWLAPDEAVALGPSPPAGTGTVLVIGPGTGFGAALLLQQDGRWLVLPSEAAHAAAGLEGVLDPGLARDLERVEGRLTIESLLSGPGIVRLYRATRARRGRPANRDTPAEIVQEALGGTDVDCVEALRHFCRALGSIAGDLALATKSTGGVFIAGGIMPRLTGFSGLTAFRPAFEAKAPMRALLERIPTRIVTAPSPALVGLAARVAHPTNFMS